jgi:hypothetical protein
MRIKININRRNARCLKENHNLNLCQKYLAIINPQKRTMVLLRSKMSKVCKIKYYWKMMIKAGQPLGVPRKIKNCNKALMIKLSQMKLK